MTRRVPKRATIVITVGTTATTLVNGDVSGGNVWIRNNHGSATVYVGGPDVSTSNGFPLKAGEILGDTGQSFLGMAPLFAVVSSGTADVSVMLTYSGPSS